jgi:parvulin-like peptidyl-prolyl isomerase
MSFFARCILLPAALALALVASACGSDDAPDTAPAGSVAVVGDNEIPKSEFDRLIEQAKKSYEAQGQEFPKTGSPEYNDLRDAIVASLVERAEFELEAEEMDIEVTDEEVEKRLDELKKQFFEGDDEKYRKEISKQGITDEQVREELRARLISEKIFEEVTSSVQVTDADIKAYYDKNKAQFEQPESREVRHILVKNKDRADEIRTRLESGESFARLAKQYSQDSSSADKGGKYTAVKGASVAPFDKFVFAAETGDLSQPVKTQFGWHVIEVLSDVKPKSVTPLAEVEQSIRDTLLRDKQNEAMRKWVNDLKDKYADQIAYAPGFAPPPTATGATTTDTTAQ